MNTGWQTMRIFGQFFGLTRYGALACLFLVGLLGIGAVAAINYWFVERTAADMAAVDAIGRERLQPRLIAAGTQLLKNDLDSRRYLVRGLTELKAAIAAMDVALIQFDRLAQDAPAVLPLPGFVSPATANNRRSLQELKTLWKDYRQLLQPIATFKAEAYVETADQGTQLSTAGLDLNRQLNEATRFGLMHHEEMAELVGTLATGIEKGARAHAEHLRIVLFAAVGAAGLLLLCIFFFLGSMSRKERAVSRAKKETDDILRTVNQGLFLLDEQLKLGSERSEALERIFRRQDFDKLGFEDLLRGIVQDKTRETASEYVKLLWGERVNEKLIKTINPLSEVEVHFDTGNGIDTQYLEFDFNRVRADGKMSRILVTVNDVTRRVQLGRELHESQEKAQAQLDMLLHVLHVEPQLLSAFLEESEVALKMVNSILKEPAREERAFRAKLDGIFRQIHSVKGEAAGLGLKTAEQRAHSFEEALAEMRGRPTLGGNDFLPLVVKLDDLFGHLSQMREMVTRLAELRVAMSGDAKPALPQNDGRTTGPEGTMIQPAPAAMLDQMLSKPEPSGLESTLASLAQRIAGEQFKQVQLSCTGFERIPNDYRRAIKDIAIQMVRNSLVHGIETPEDRARLGKEAKGRIAMSFGNHAAGGYEFVCQDDGRGLTAERIKQTAVSRGLLTAEQAAKLDDRRALSLIFLAGFSTQGEVTKDAGRGVGMDIVRNRVVELGGKLGVSTAADQYLRFRIWLPASAAADQAAA